MGAVGGPFCHDEIAVMCECVSFLPCSHIPYADVRIRLCHDFRPVWGPGYRPDPGTMIEREHNGARRRVPNMYGLPGTSEDMLTVW